jgi:hypothetical protein
MLGMGYDVVGIIEKNGVKVELWDGNLSVMYVYVMRWYVSRENRLSNSMLTVDLLKRKRKRKKKMKGHSWQW